MAVVMVLWLSVSLIAVAPAGAAQTSSPPEGNGTAADPYVITTVEELQWMENDPNGTYVLGNDIDATATTTWNHGAGFDPVGRDTLDDPGPRFQGTFDGQGYTIDGLYIHRPDEDATGLFGTIGNSGAVRSVTVTDVTVRGSTKVGAIAGQNRGIISRTAMTGTIEAFWTAGGIVGDNYDTVVDSAAESRLRPIGGGRFGGLVGRSWHRGEVIRSTATTDIDSPNTGYTGGLVGRSYGNIIDSNASGTVVGAFYVGGLVGQSYGIITFSWASTDVGDDENKEYSHDVGGLVGENYRSIGHTGYVIYYGKIVESYATGDVVGGEQVGGLAGESGFIIDSYATGDVRGIKDVGGLAGTNSTRIHRSFSTGAVSGTRATGGLVGASVNPNSSSYWNVVTANQSTSPAGIGLTTSEMTGGAAIQHMEGLDFETTWVTTDSYPQLAVHRSDDPVVVLAGPDRQYQLREVLVAIARFNSNAQIGQTGTALGLRQVLEIVEGFNSDRTLN